MYAFILLSINQYTKCEVPSFTNYKAEWRYCNLFRNVKATNENDSVDFANFDPKIGCHGNVL